MQEKESLIKQINKLMIEKAFEISIILALIGLSIPAWDTLAANIDIDHVERIKVEGYNLNFSYEKENDVDHLYIENKYALIKNYTVYLEIPKNINAYNVEILINDKPYALSEFPSQSIEDKNQFTIINKNIVNNLDTYTIRLNNIDKVLDYQYAFAENNNF